MKIGIDITPIIYGRGVSRYTNNLVASLLQEPNVSLSLFGSSARQAKELKKIAKGLINISAEPNKHNYLIKKLPPSLLNLTWKFGFNSIKKNLPEVQVFHSWDWIQPPDKKIPLVSTIHDLAILKFPETAHPKVIEMHQQSWKILKQREAQIIAVSRATKNDIINLLGIPAFRIEVIPEALPLETRLTNQQLTEEKAGEIAKRLQLFKPYLLFVGTREPRKNLAKLIEAWQPLSRDYQLIIAGEEGWDQTAGSGGISPNLRFLGKVTEEELAVLYGEAEVFVYPSLYEGFGLPILESFYHGTPVVTSNVPAIVEVAGNAAEFIEPDSVESIRAGIVKILNEPLHQQQIRLQKMIIRLQMFSWQKVAMQTLKVYKKAIDLQQSS
jgi:glycosyltransferase involved in cell wall biosynthesis